MWRAHCENDLFLLKHLPAGGLGATPSSGGSHVGAMCGHMNDVRMRWLDNAAPELTATLAWFEKQPNVKLDVAHLQRALEQSSLAVSKLVVRCQNAGAGVKDFPGPLASFLGYLIAHESYHL